MYDFLVSEASVQKFVEDKAYTRKTLERDFKQYTDDTPKKFVQASNTLKKKIKFN